MEGELILVVTLIFCCDGSGIIGWISIQSYPFNLDASGAAVSSVNIVVYRLGCLDSFLRRIYGTPGTNVFLWPNLS